MKVAWFEVSDFLESSSSATNKTSANGRLLTDYEFFVLQASSSCLLFCGAVFGIFTNIINLTVFVGINVKDGSSACFFALSIVDLAFSTLSFVNSVIICIFAVELRSGPQVYVDPYFLLELTWITSRMVYTLNSVLTLIIAVSRCLCVVKPFKFKHAFSYRRTVCIIVAIVALTVGSFAIIFIDQGWAERFVPKLNTTRPTAYKRMDMKHIALPFFFILFSLIPCASEIILIVCVVLMSTALKRNTEFKRSMSAKPGPDAGKTSMDHGAMSDSRQSRPKLAGKEFQAIQQVLLISTLYFSCSLPGIVLSVAHLFVEDFGVEPENLYAKTFVSLHTLKLSVEQVNCAINIFIYLKYNRKFYKYFSNKFLKT